MNFGKILDLITKNNVDPEKVFLLVDKIKNADLNDEATLRSIIKEVAAITGKNIDKLQEDAIVKLQVEPKQYIENFSISKAKTIKRIRGSIFRQ